MRGVVGGEEGELPFMGQLNGPAAGVISWRFVCEL